MPNCLAAPIFDDPEQTQRSRILHFVICGTVLVTVCFIALVMIHQPATFSRGMFTLAFISALGLTLLRLNQRGRTQLAAALFAGGLLVLITALAVAAGGVRSPGVTMYFVIVLMAGLLLGKRAGTITALVGSALGFGLLLAERSDLLPPGIRYSSTTIWLLSCLYMGVVIALLRVPAMLTKASLFHVESELVERRRAEMLMRENWRLLQTMIENSPVAVAMFDTEMRYIAYSKRWVADYRLGNRDLRGLSHYEVVPEIGEEWKAVHRRCLAGARESRDADRFVHIDGTEDIIHWVVQPWIKADGEIGGITMFTEVITERVRAEEERKYLREQLLEAQKFEALGTFAGGIAHEFNNILAMIGTNAELGLAEMKDEGSAHTSFQEIVRATARAKNTVRQIFYFSRREAAVLETISLIPIAEDALAFFHATLPANVEIRKVLKPGLPPIMGNASQIYQILLNLGTNAAQAMPAGGILSVELDAVDVTIAEAAMSMDLQVAKYVRLAVQDTGTGMSPEICERIFEPFFTTKGPDGTGLGLSVVHGIVKGHGGAIKVESKTGSGSTFRVYFPAAPIREAGETATAQAQVAGRGQHILYIDDEESLGLAMTRVLTRLGYRCTFFSSPEAALEVFRNDPGQFDAVITDMTMPRLSGFEMVKQLREIRPAIPIALTSGKIDKPITRSDPGNIKVWISKPATIQELSRALVSLLQNSA
jgi:PAS domain S-box-containing protein